MPAKTFELRDLELQVASVSGDGMHLEICVGDHPGRPAGLGPDPLAWFRASEEGLIRFEFLAPEGVISLPLAELERAIASAKVEVHSEGHYGEPTDS